MVILQWCSHTSYPILSYPIPQGRHSRRPGEEESDVDIEGFEEEDDGKPKTPAPVRKKKKLPTYYQVQLQIYVMSTFISGRSIVVNIFHSHLDPPDCAGVFIFYFSRKCTSYILTDVEEICF